MSIEIPAAEAETAASAVGASAGVATWVALSGAPAFQRVLQQRPCAKSDHFALHCLRTAKLSTGNSPSESEPVDELLVKRSARPVRKRPDCPRLGLVVPKRMARRAVTRNLIKRQVRAFWDLWCRDAAMKRVDFELIDWVVRLRAPVDKRRFVSARSDELGALLRSELPGLFEAGARRLGPAGHAGV